jgi:LacI family transcriptional regulator
MEKPRISDIARLSGVSAATVSLVLNDKPGVSQETRARVLKIAEELEYPLKSMTTNGISGRLATIGMIVKTDPDSPPQANPFYSKVILGIEDVCRRSGINLLFATLPVDEDNCPVEVPQLLSNEHLDGLLMVSTLLTRHHKTASAATYYPGRWLLEYRPLWRSDLGQFQGCLSGCDLPDRKRHGHIGLLGSDVNTAV